MKWVYKTWGKVVLFLLLTISIGVLGVCTLAYIAHFNSPLNEGEGKEAYVERKLDEIQYQDVEWYFQVIFSTLEETENSEINFLPEEYGVQFKVWYDGELVEDTYTGEAYKHKEERVQELYLYANEERGIVTEAKVELYLLENTSENSYLSDHTSYIEEEYENWNLLQEYWIYIQVGLVVSGIVTLSLVVILTIIAGKRAGEKGIYLNQLDRIPFDILVGIWVIAATSGIAGMNWVFNRVIGVLGVVIAAFLTGIIYFTFCTRVKAGKWWKNTVVFIALKWCKDVVKQLFVLSKSRYVRFKMVKQVIVTSVIVTIVELLLSLVGGINNIYQIWTWFLIIVGNTVLGGGAILICIWFQKLKDATMKIVDEDIHHQVDTNLMFGEFKEFAEAINRIGNGMNHAMEERLKSERLKTELITNVSHDIKTPLTSIINYVDLIKKVECENKEVGKYIEVLDRQSQKLKRLITDLVDASKISSGNVKIELAKLDLGVMAKQLEGEFLERLQEADLELIVTFPETATYVSADGRQLQRICDNLINNILKYSLKGTRVYVTVENNGDTTQISFKNTSKNQLNIRPEELMERFVRGDESRNTEGNGLGLSIADSLAKAQNAKMDIIIDGDLFKVIISFEPIFVEKI